MSELDGKSSNHGGGCADDKNDDRSSDDGDGDDSDSDGDDHTQVRVRKLNQTCEGLLLVGNFKHRTLGTTQLAQTMFVPEGYEFDREKMLEVVAKRWQLPLPNMLVKCDAGSAHPKDLATELLVAQDQFADWKENAMFDDRTRQVRMKKKKASTFLPFKRKSSTETGSTPLQGITVEAETPLQPGLAREVISNVLYQKLVDVFAAVLDAAKLSNNWIVVDRTRGSSPTAELLLELAIQRTKCQPTIIVIDSLQRMKKFSCPEANDIRQQLEDVKESARPFGSDNEVVSEVEHSLNAEKFLDWKKFVSKDLPCKAKSSHLVNGQVSDKRKWQYHYLAGVFPLGTHYIFMESEDDKFPLEMFGRTGYVAAHGGTVAYQRLRNIIQGGESLVMLYNSGGASQAFASIQRILARKPAARIQYLTSHMQITSKEKWANSFGVAEVMLMKSLCDRSPSIFRKNVVSVDLIKDSAEDVLDTITACMASTETGLPELGLGSAETKVVLSAWSSFINLGDTAKTFLRRSQFLHLLVALLSLTTTLVAVIYSSLERLNLNAYANTFTAVLVVLPICTGLVTAVSSKMRYIDQYSYCEMGSKQILCEIYKFRTRTGMYEDSRRLETSGQTNEGGVLIRNVRQLFVNRVQFIWGQVMEQLTSSGYIHFKQKHMNDTSIEDPLSGNFYTALKTYAKTNQLTIIQNAEDDGSERVDVDVNSQADSDDLVSKMSIESYVNSRGSVVADSFRFRGPILARALTGFEIFGFVCVSAAGILPLIKMAEWVAVAVALTVQTNLLVEYLSLRGRLSSTNNGLSKIQNMFVWWSSCSVVDRRTRQAKAYVVEAVEGALLTYTRSTVTEVVGSLKLQDDEEQDEEQEENKAQ
eukprot:CAMPEP_0175136710 /NCGR_PEP_ID=MMETSP0087-20121206/9427_1 /TAXON_ID=136419 /ORGANISM="Unknown Unknown, Strain D1" /LENGTH=869 /DNA_ID=CAMNT_0016419497 /DNA_START=108 /DNA_END=2717 /DNA_ORIENTATION=-